MRVGVDTLVFDRFSQASTNAIVARRGRVDTSESEFRNRIGSWRAILRETSGETIALYEPDGVEFAAALMGAWYANKTVYLPGDAQRDTCRALSAIGTTFVGAFPAEFEPVSAREVEANSHFDPLDPETVHVMIFTSGSTGAPQAVPKRLGQLLAEVHTLEKMFGARVADSNIVSTVSHQHIYGLLFKILWPLQYKRTFVAGSVVYPEQLLSTLGEQKCAIVSGPAHLKRLPESLDWKSVNQNVSLIFSSGGPLPLESATSVESVLGVAPVEVYGSSETGGVASRQRTNGVDKPWTPFPGVSVAARDGQLAVRSAHLPSSDWYPLQDNATFDALGNFTLLGRADRIAKIEGKRISLVGIEDALLTSGLVSEARVVQLESLRDELGAVVVPNEAGWTVLREGRARGLRARLDAVLAHSFERLAHPRRWRWADALPANDVGKTTLAATLETFGEFGVERPAVHLLNHSPEHASLELYVSPHLAAFDGHFANAPVLAGVVQVDWAMRQARRLFVIDSKFERMEAIKFLRVYQPGPMLRLGLEWNAERRLLSFRFESDSNVHSSGRIFFGA